MKTKFLSTLTFCHYKSNLFTQKQRPEVNLEFRQSNRSFLVLKLTLTLGVFFISGLLHAQIQFEQVPAPRPAPQNIAKFEGVEYGSIAFADIGN